MSKMLIKGWEEKARERDLSADQITALYLMEGPTKEYPQKGSTLISTFDEKRYVRLSHDDYWDVQEFRKQFVVRRVA